MQFVCCSYVTLVFHHPSNITTKGFQSLSLFCLSLSVCVFSSIWFVYSIANGNISHYYFKIEFSIVCTDINSKKSFRTIEFSSSEFPIYTVFPLVVQHLSTHLPIVNHLFFSTTHIVAPCHHHLSVGYVCVCMCVCIFCLVVSLATDFHALSQFANSLAHFCINELSEKISTYTNGNARTHRHRHTHLLTPTYRNHRQGKSNKRFAVSVKRQ